MESNVHFDIFGLHFSLYIWPVWMKVIGIFFIVVVISFYFQLLAGMIISFIAVMAVIGSLGNLPLNIGTPGLVRSDFLIY